MTRDDDGPALRAERLGKRYGHVWGLRDCTFAVPAGSVVGLVGPNGAGKTTLLALAVGLLTPTEGQVEVFGEASRAYTGATLARVSYLAQDHPLYRSFSVADMFHFGRSMNPSWDQELAEMRMDALGIPLGRKVKELSGGQQAQVSLTIALAKRSPLLILDEPVASLDPIDLIEFMRDVMAACAEGGLTVIIASHVVSELERLCDWLIVLGGARRAGPIDDLLDGHRMLTVPRPTPDGELPGTVIDRADSDRHSSVIVAADLGQLAAAQRPGWQAEPVGFEQLVLAYLRRPPVGGQRAVRGRVYGAGGGARGTWGAVRAGVWKGLWQGLWQDGSGEGGGHPMIWVTWRQHRTQAIVCLGVFCALAIFAVAVGSLMRSAFDADGLGACLARSGGSGCPAVITSFMHRFDGPAAITANLPLFVIPGLVGVVVGAPLLGRELERGTWQLAWSQTVPRTRWLVTKLALVTGGLVVFGLAITAVMSWYHAPLDQVSTRLQPPPFNFEGVLLPCSLLCAFGLGVLAGLLLRNTIGGMVGGVHHLGDPDRGDHAAERSDPVSPGGHRADHLPGVVRGRVDQLHAAGHRPPRRPGAERGAPRRPADRDVHTGKPVLDAAAHRGRAVPRHRRRGARHGRLAAPSAYHLTPAG